MSYDIDKMIEEWEPGEWDDLKNLLHRIAEMCNVPVDQETTQDIKTSSPKNKGA